jgi:hypothetical protein
MDLTSSATCVGNSQLEIPPRPYIHGIPSVVLPLHPLISEEHDRCAHLPIIQFQNVFQYSNVMHGHITCVRRGDLEHICHSAVEGLHPC